MIIDKVIVHILDTNADIPVLSTIDINISPEIDAFYQKIIRKILRADSLRKGQFLDYKTNEIRIISDELLYDESKFVESSKKVAKKLFDIIKVSSELDSCDFATVLFTHKDIKYVAYINLNYKRMFSHHVEVKEDNVIIKQTTNDIGVQDGTTIYHAAIISPSGINDEWHLQVLDREAFKQNLSESSFISNFLCSELVIDDSYKTKVFKKVTDNWLKNAYSYDLKHEEGIRGMVNYTLKESESIHVEKFIEDNIEDLEKKEEIKEVLEKYGVSGEFDIDKDWVEKKIKSRSIKTNTGFTLKGLLENFEDPMKYSLKKNDDGTYNITIKNIEFYE